MSTNKRCSFFERCNFNQILACGNKEWRSKKDVYVFLRDNRLQDWKVIGWVSSRTIEKWEGWDMVDMCVIAKGNEWKYVYSLGFSRDISNSVVG